MGTFSKSFASCGGFIAGPSEVIEYLRIAARSFLFSAAAVPAAVGAALEALRIIRSDGPELLGRLGENAAYLHRGLSELGLRVVEATTLADGSEALTPIVPVVIGDDMRAVMLWKALYDEGVYTNVALHPAVPPSGALAADEPDGDARTRASRRGPRGIREGDRALPRARRRLTRPGSERLEHGTLDSGRLTLIRVVSPCPLEHKSEVAPKTCS